MKRSLSILLFGSVLLGLVLILVTRLSVTTDMAVFLPGGAEPAERFLSEELEKGLAGRSILIGLEGADPQALAKTSRAMADALRETDLFNSVNNGEGIWSAQEQEVLFRARYLLSPNMNPDTAGDRFTPKALHAALNRRLEHLASSAAVIAKDRITADPTGEFEAVLYGWEQGNGVVREHGVLFSDDRARALMVLATEAPGSDLDGQERAIAAVQRAFAATASPSMSLRLSGPPVIAVESRAHIRADAAVLSAVGLTLVVGFLYLAFRSARVVALTALPLAFGVLAGIAAVTLAFGSIHGITIAFGAVLVGMTVDYPLHFFGQLTSTWNSPAEHLRRVWPTLRLGVITTLIAFLALLYSEHTGLAQLGAFSLAGIIAAAATTRWLLPALVARGFTVRPGGGLLHNLLEVLVRAAPPFRLVFVLLAALAAVPLYFAGSAMWENNLAKLSPIPAELKANDDVLRRDLRAPAAGQVLLVVAPSQEQALVHLEGLSGRLEALAADGLLEGYETAARYLPSTATQRARQAALPAAEELRGNMWRANRWLLYRSDAFNAFLESVEQARTRRPLTLRDLEGTSLGQRLAPLLFESQGQWIAPVPLRGVKDSAALAALNDETGPVKTLYLDLKQESSSAMADYRQAALILCAWGALGIFIALVLGLRSLRRAAFVLLAPAAAVVAVCGILVAAGTALTLFHLVSLLLVVGLGIDYALYFDRLADARDEWQTTFPALWKAWLTTVLGFGVLAFSGTPVLQSIGVTVSLGVTACFLFAAAWAPRPRIAGLFGSAFR